MGFDLYGQEPKNKFGEYFRQNVWGWRPIWEYVCTHHADSLDQKTLEMGNYNEGHIVSKQQATTLANKIHVDLQDGTVSDFVKMVEDSVKKAKEHNKFIDKQMNDLLAKHNVKAACDLEPKHKEEWDKIYAEHDWADSYPFAVDNLESFIKFCRESGGFEIC